MEEKNINPVYKSICDFLYEEEANIDRTAISKLEKGKFLPTISFILAISQTLHIELIYFFIGA